MHLLDSRALPRIIVTNRYWHSLLLASLCTLGTEFQINAICTVCVKPIEEAIKDLIAPFYNLNSLQLCPRYWLSIINQAICSCLISKIVMTIHIMFEWYFWCFICAQRFNISQALSDLLASRDLCHSLESGENLFLGDPYLWAQSCLHTWTTGAIDTPFEHYFLNWLNSPQENFNQQMTTLILKENKSSILCISDTTLFTNSKAYRNPLRRSEVVVVSFTGITYSVHAYMHTYYHTLSSSTVCYDYSYTQL